MVVIRRNSLRWLCTALLLACGSDGSDSDATHSNVNEGGGSTGSASAGNDGSGGSTSGGSTNGGSTNGGSTNSGTTGEGGSDEGLTLEFASLFSAYNGVQNFRVPVRVAGEHGEVTWSASDPEMVDIELTADGAMITTRAAGTVTIIAEADGLRGSALLEITEVTEEDWELGKERYNNGVAAGFPNFEDGPPDFGDGGIPNGPPDFDSESACTNCHGEGSSFVDVEHTPQQTGGYSDEELIAIFTLGKKPEGAAFHVIPQIQAGMEQFRMELEDTLAALGINLSDLFGEGIREERDVEDFEQGWTEFHQWSMTEEEKRGILVYLRAIEPKSQGALDFGGFPDITEIIDRILTGDFGGGGN